MSGSPLSAQPGAAPAPARGWRRLAQHTLLRFLVVGVLNTGFSYSIYAFFVFVGLDYKLANLLSLLLGIAFSFKTQSMVFGNRDPRLILRFASAWFVIYLINIAVIGALIRLGMNAYWAGVLALLPVALMSYAVQRWWVFGRGRPAHAGPDEGR